MRFDPWEHAAELARRLDDNAADTRLVVALGAAWCHKCHDLRPVFDTFAAQAPETDLLLWLDIDEHASFIGDYFPDDLPEVLIYRQGRLLGRDTLTATEACLADTLAARSRLTLPDTNPAIWQRLAAKDWAAEEK